MTETVNISYIILFHDVFIYSFILTEKKGFLFYSSQLFCCTEYIAFSTKALLLVCVYIYIYIYIYKY